MTDYDYVCAIVITLLAALTALASLLAILLGYALGKGITLMLRLCNSAQLDRLDHLLEEILIELRLLRRRLEPRFVLRIRQAELVTFTTPTLRSNHTYWRLFTMAAIAAGQTGIFLLSATASDNSVPVLASQQLTASDPTVTVKQDTSDPSGNTFDVTVPASDSSTSFTLSASASVTSPTSPTPQTITASESVTVSPSTQPVTFTLTINQKS